METPSVLLTTEGTYPCRAGGVSVWCDKLIRGLPEVDFHLLAITGSPDVRRLFGTPDNLVSSSILPLWGTEEPGAEEKRFSDTYQKKLRTTRAVIDEEFLCHFQSAVRCLLTAGGASDELALAFVRLHQYFRKYDFAASMSSPRAWDTFLEICKNWPGAGAKMSLDEATSCMRWLQRYLAVLSADLPTCAIVHASMSGFAGIPGVILKQLQGVPFLLTEHGVYLRELYISLGQSGYTPVCRRFLLSINESVIRMNYQFADAVTTLCEFNRKWQIQLGANPRKIWNVPNGVEEGLFFPGHREPAEPPVVLTMSRMNPLKGIDVLLRAAVLVRDRLPGVRFRILGDSSPGEYRDRCMRIIADHKLSGTVELGATSDAPSAYRSADLFCLPSISEAMPYSVIEAMLSGCAVVATDVGGIPDLLAGTGRLCKPNSSESLAAALIELLHGIDAPAKRARLATSALARARKHYTLRQTTARFRNLYQTLGANIQGPYAISEMPEPVSRGLSLVASG